jgi:hypothetical protein
MLESVLLMKGIGSCMLRRHRILQVHNSQFQSSRRPPLSSRFDNQSGNRSGNRSDNQSGNRSDNRSDNRFGNLSGNRSGNLSGNLFGNLSDNLSGRQYPSHKRSLRPSVSISSDSKYPRGGHAPLSIPIQLLLKHSIVSDRCLKASV